ncbi:hypothetical protein [uncultured Roseovarius sp.]|uniref:hypothetical protein n=1 Tax=uncultured Roseovarius sp. TaxID=293344 RepID=UPI0026080D07|nr:hypothetical protein [uncultured Roseovarius sp.]
MKDFGLFSERDAASAARKLDQLVHFAERRETLLENIDLDALDKNTAFDILTTDEDLAETIAFGPIYVHHLATLEAQRAEIAATLPRAA